ncbi:MULTISPECIES: amidohydrolase [unclassified Bradyrhizobium]|uniref:amidohydrolase n=1 Tax=unclassified Bradyrhizobium TaxID=2631580 RepID=UPI001FF7A454|nr:MULTISPECIES: amidohydrolase [unclassified Bradyrhizobium]MCK1297245.1 amidohydrolase [Bradyrhizobium sp. 37]MCK1769250.1 amidohydrolase [Bradyrhizobium sp. 134]
MRKLLAILVISCWASLAYAQKADLIVTNAKIVTLDPASTIAQALAVRDGKIVAVGGNDAMEVLIGPATRRVDAGGRTIIPGLIDSHIHAVRAGLTYATEVNWIGAKTIPEAMERLRQAATARPASWIIVAGGWSELQFAEKRRPTLAEVMSAVLDNPAYIQLFYSAVLMTPKAQQALGMSADQLPAGITAEPAASGDTTGWFNGSIVSISALFDRLPRPNFDENVAGTRQFFTELNRLGVTGIVDPGGFSIYPSHYAALQKLWRDKSLSVRVAFSLFAQNVGAEFEEYKTLTPFLPMGFGDDMLRFNGIGERITGAMYNNNAPDAAAKDKFREIIRWAAKQGLTVTIHWQEDKSVHHLLDLYDEVNKETPLAPLRWSIAHLDNTSPQTLARMKALGVGWTMQDAMYLGGDRIVAQAGEAARSMPPLATALRIGVHVGAGTDAHRVASYNPFVALQWMLDGKTVGGLSTRGPDETPSREDALRLYTAGSAWFCFDETRRGTLETGKLADFAILDRDFMSIPVEQIGATASLLTVVGGKVVYAADAFASAK